MSLSTLRESSVILIDYTTYTPWLHQLQTRCVSLDVWELIDPAKNTLPKTKPIIPTEPDIAAYEPKSSLGFDEGGTIVMPSAPSELSANGLKAWKENTEFYKFRLETYKAADREYREERANLDKVVVFIQNTVSPNLMKSCCKPGDSLRAWISNLKQTVGIDAREERLRARQRFLAALKPMRNPGNWDTWLNEYDQAATNAESEGVAEVQVMQDIVQDFLDAVLKVAPTWTSGFMDYGQREVNMTRKEMMKRFREHMSMNHPIKGRQQRAAFAAGDASFLAAGGASTPGTDRDASRAADNASSTLPSQGSRGRPRNKRSFGQATISKQSSKGDTAAARGSNCPACEQRHGLENCYYVYKDKAPQWFVPRSGIAAMVSWRLEHDTDLQELLRGEKRYRGKGNNSAFSTFATSTE